MITKLKSVRFIFENCDSLTIDGKYIGKFLVDDLHTYFRRLGCNSIGKTEAANTIAIEIHKDANKERYMFDQPHEDWKQMTFDRFTEYNDITYVNFELEEECVDEGKVPYVESYSYYVNWVGNSDYENDAQTTYISNENNLYIVIAKDKEIKDFFDLEEINDSEEMDLYFNLCDVGDEYGNPDRYKDDEEEEL